MKKRILAFLLAAAMLLAMCACTIKTAEKDKEEEKTEQTESDKKSAAKDKNKDKGKNEDKNENKGEEKEEEPDGKGKGEEDPEKKPEENDGSKSDPEPGTEGEKKPETSEYDNFYGSWVMYSGEIEGYRDTAKNFGVDCLLIIYGEDKADFIWDDIYGEENDYSFIGMDIVYNDFPLYDSCANDTWCADLITEDKSRELCAALTGPDELEMLMFSYFDGEEYPTVFMANFRRMTDSATEGAGELVTDEFSDTLEVGGETLEYAIPHINIDSIRIQTLNDAIYEKYYNEYYLQYVKANMEEFGEPGYAVINYSWNVADDMLSIIITAEPYYYEFPEYEVYNISISQGRMLSDEEFLAVCCIEYDEFLSGVKDILGSYYCRSYEVFKDYADGNDDQMAFYKEQLMKTIDEENVKLAHPYINESGELMIVGRVYSLAGADYYNELISYNYPISEDYLKIIRS
ncbi:MAG: hypothetical protein II784_00580 [Oscillospiraceae bacterium]|nr:hypothetical protein [Oscillospiraceae bacterium]